MASGVARDVPGLMILSLVVSGSQTAGSLASCPSCKTSSFIGRDGRAGDPRDRRRNAGNPGHDIRARLADIRRKCYTPTRTEVQGKSEIARRFVTERSHPV